MTVDSLSTSQAAAVAALAVIGSVTFTELEQALRYWRSIALRRQTPRDDE